jgi:hypothetical protein
MRAFFHCNKLFWIVGAYILSVAANVYAEPAAVPEKAPTDKPAAAADVPGEPPGLTRLVPNKPAWIDKQHGRVIVDGTIALREGTLEMFACLKNTKEHESVVVLDVEAFVIHAALLAVGAKVGTPVQFQPTFKPPTGQVVDIACIWTDENGKAQRKPAQYWIRDLKTKKDMSQTWVFAGSMFWKDEETGERRYQAEGGYVACVSNFGAAMLDLPVESSSQAADLAFEAFTEHIPKKGTPVRLVFTPRAEKPETNPPKTDNPKSP